jgi:hypothetical protein
MRLPARRERPRQHRQNPSRCRRSTVACWNHHPTFPSTEANTVATRAKADDQMRESVHFIKRGCRIGAAWPDSRVRSLFASPRPNGRARPFGRRAASLVQLPACALTSNDSCLDDVLARQLLSGYAHRALPRTALCEAGSRCGTCAGALVSRHSQHGLHGFSCWKHTRLNVFGEPLE